ncbi:MAG: hypothetical protein ACLP7J_17345 [Streptosporangiaceae bacterium]
MTIASFNVRAQRVVQALGFRPVSSFPATADGRWYQILIRREQPVRAQGSSSSGA